MPYNGSGTFQSLPPPQFPAVAGSVIRASYFNAVVNDLIAGLTNAVTRDGQSAPTSNLPMAGKRHTGVSDAAAVDQYASYGQLLSGLSLMQFTQADAGAIARSLFDKLQEISVSPKDFGGKSDGVTDDTVAMQAALATGRPVKLPPGTTIVAGLSTTIDSTIFADSPAAILKLKASSNTHVIKTTGDVKLRLLYIGIDGNYTAQTLIPNYPCGVLVPVGSLFMFGCYVKNVLNHCIHTGNTDYDFSAGAFAHDVVIANNLVEQPTSGVGDLSLIHI